MNEGSPLPKVPKIRRDPKTGRFIGSDAPTQHRVSNAVKQGQNKARVEPPPQDPLPCVPENTKPAKVKTPPKPEADVYMPFVPPQDKISEIGANFVQSVRELEVPTIDPGTTSQERLKREVDLKDMGILPDRTMVDREYARLMREQHNPEDLKRFKLQRDYLVMKNEEMKANLFKLIREQVESRGPRVSNNSTEDRGAFRPPANPPQALLDLVAQRDIGHEDNSSSSSAPSNNRTMYRRQRQGGIRLRPRPVRQRDEDSPFGAWSYLSTPRAPESSSVESEAMSNEGTSGTAMTASASDNVPESV